MGGFHRTGHILLSDDPVAKHPVTKDKTNFVYMYAHIKFGENYLPCEGI